MFQIRDQSDAAHLHPSDSCDRQIFVMLPFIGHRAHLSRVYLSGIVLACLFLLTDLLQAYYSVDPYAGELRQRVLEECQELQTRADAILDTPKRMAQSTNEATVKFAQKSLDKTFATLKAGVELVGQIIAWVVNAYKSLLRCVVEAVIDSGLTLLRENARQIQESLQKAMDGLTDASNKLVEGTTSGLNTAIDTIDFLNVIPNNGRPIPEVKSIVPRVEIPRQLEEALATLNPNAASDLDKNVQDLMMKPFALAQQGLDGVKAGIVVNFSLFQLPEMQSLSICRGDQLDLAWIEVLAEPLKQAIVTGIVLVCVGCFICICAKMYWVHVNNSLFEEALAKTRVILGECNEFSGDEVLRKVVYDMERPRMSRFTKAIGLRISRGNSELETRVRWFLDYILYGPGWMILGVGISGIILTGLQYRAIDEIQLRVVPEISARMNDFVDETVGKIDYAIDGVTGDFVNGTNIAIRSLEMKINDKAFGPIREAVSQFNGTVMEGLNTAKRFLTETLHLKIFGPLVEKLWDCIITKNVAKLELVIKIIDRLKVEIPLVDEDVFQVNTTRVYNSVNKFRDRVFGVEMNDENGNLLGYSGGKVGEILAIWRRRIDFSRNVSIWTTLFGSLLFVQGFIGFMFLRPSSIAINRISVASSGATSAFSS